MHNSTDIISVYLHKIWSIDAYKCLPFKKGNEKWDNNFMLKITKFTWEPYEPPHDKTNKTTVCPAKTQIN